MIKKVTSVFLTFLFCTGFSGCGYVRQINEMAYVVGIGLDKGENENILLSLQFAKPMVVSGKSSGGEEEEKTQENKTTSLVSAEGKNIFSAIAVLESSLSKQINLTHAKILLFSEDIAKEGVLEYTENLMGNNQFRPNTYAAVARGGAKSYFEKVKPALELNPAKYYTLMFSKDTKSFVPEVTLKDLYFSLKLADRAAVLPVVGTIEEKSGESSAAFSDFIAGEKKKTGENKTDSAGMALFNEDRLAEILPSSDAEIFNIITGNYKEGYYNLSDNGKTVSVRLKTEKKPKICVKTAGGLSASVKIKLSAETLSYNGSDNRELERLKRLIEEDIKKRAENFISKNKEFGCDTVGFGKYGKKNFLTVTDWENFKWKEKFPQINVNFSAETLVTGGNLIK